MDKKHFIQRMQVMGQCLSNYALGYWNSYTYFNEGSSGPDYYVSGAIMDSNEIRDLCRQVGLYLLKHRIQVHDNGNI